MTTPLLLPETGAALFSAHVAPDAIVLVGRPMREDSGSSPRFADDRWDMAPAYYLPNHHRGQAVIHFGKISDPCWRLTAKEYAYARLTKITEGCKKLPSVVTVARELRELQALFAYLEQFHGGLRLHMIDDDAVLEGFLDHRIDGGRTKAEHRAQGRGRVKWFLTLLHRTRTSMTYDRLERVPWDGRASRLVTGARSQENITPRIPPQILGPYLRGALFYLRVASKDILAALAEQERLRQPVGSQGVPRNDPRASLAGFIDSRRRQGRGLPARPSSGCPHHTLADGGVNRTLVAQLCRVGPAVLDHKACLAVLREAVAELGLEEGGMDTDILRTRTPADPGGHGSSRSRCWWKPACCWQPSTRSRFTSPG
ncbi:hypothetical protein [Streptomyces anulatus]|uniref:Integrase n=1 Tax=Streptomyces anulatus TaxID=1892 RepID=A0ABZ1ZWP0_STRAQ|nr:hypothetical protein [Streptomyces anulatus]